MTKAAKELIEVRWHGRGGQGAVTAAKILAEAALGEGKHVQAFPEFGPERAGAPVKSFNRISDKPIVIHSQVTNPDIVAVLDHTLLDTVDICEGLLSGGTVIINTPEAPAGIRKKLSSTNVKLYTVDATDIAIKELKRNIPNTPMIAALLKVTKLLSFDNLINDFKTKFEKKFRPEIIEANVRAMRAAYDGVRGE